MRIWGWGSRRHLRKDFKWSDGWLLTTIACSSDHCDRKELLCRGDYLNRDIFTDSEIADGMARLASEELAWQDGDFFRITESGRAFVMSVIDLHPDDGIITNMFRICDKLTGRRGH